MVKWQVLETRPRELINLEFIASRHSLFCIQVKNQKGRCVLLPREAVKTFHGNGFGIFAVNLVVISATNHPFSPSVNSLT